MVAARQRAVTANARQTGRNILGFGHTLPQLLESNRYEEYQLPDFIQELPEVDEDLTLPTFRAPGHKAISASVHSGLGYANQYPYLPNGPGDASEGTSEFATMDHDQDVALDEDP